MGPLIDPKAPLLALLVCQLVAQCLGLARKSLAELGDGGKLFHGVRNGQNGFCGFFRVGFPARLDVLRVLLA